MRRVLELRISRWELKFVYVLAVWLLAPIPGAVTGWLGANEMVSAFVAAATTIACVLYGARIFRGRGEPSVPPRPWWQMTARPRLSQRLGAVFFAIAITSLVATALAASGAIPGATSVGAAFIASLEWAALAYLYLNSGIRLSRRGEITSPTPTYKPKRIPMR